MATREAAPKTWPSGEKAAERIKEEREKQQQNPDGDEEKIIDDLQWKQNVTDLHKVMEVAKSLWLIHEHSNEAMIRTALEIAMDRRCKKVLWWPDFWFSDHDKREHFKEIIRVKLAIAIANAKGAAVDLSDFDKENEGDSELVQNLRRQIAELEAALRAARAAQAAAEARCRELEEIADEAKKRAAALEKAMETLRKEARSEAKETVASAGDSGAEDEIKRLKQQLAQSEEKNQKLEEIIKELRKQLKQGGSEGPVATSDSTNNSDLAAAQRRIEELEKQIKALRKEIAELKKGTPQVVKEKVAKAPTGNPELDDLQEQLDAERKRREELEEELRKMQEKLELLQKELELEKKKAADLQAQMKALLDKQKGFMPQAAAEAPPPQQVIEVGGMTPEQLAELEELRAKAAQVDKLLAKLKKRDQQIASLQEENERLNDEQMKLLKMLKQVREQLRIVMELAEKKGLGDVIKKLFEEAGLADTMADPEYTCFDRLYDDALRRMDKQRRLEWFRLGNTGEPPAWFKGKNPYRRRGDSSPMRSGAGAGSGTSEREHSSSGGTTLYCRNCGFPVREAPWRGDSPGPPGAARAESLESRSPAPNPYRSNAPTYVELEQEGRDHSRQRSPSQGSRAGGQMMRSQSPPTAHALDMRIDVVKPGEGGMAYAVANFSVEESHGWDAPAGVPAQVMKRPSPMQPDMARMARSGPNFHRGPAQLHHQQLDPLQGGGPKGRSRSPVDRSLGQRTSNSQQRMARSTSDLRGNLPRLAAAESPQMRQSPPMRTLAGSSSAADLRQGPSSYGEGPLPIPGGGHARMRGVMLVEHPRAPMGEEGPRMMWRPHKNSPDLHKSAAGGWGPGLS